jgi:hypothetical protein
MKKSSFAGLFVISACAFIISLIAYVFPSRLVTSGSTIALTVLIMSLLTFIASPVGFVFSTVLPLRRERKEKRASELEIVKKRLQ